MKFILYFLIILLPLVNIHAQQLNSHVSEGVAYVNYNVEKSEGLNAIASKYGIGNAMLLQANNLPPSVVLQQGQIIKIPIATIIKQTCNGANCIPVFYVVQQSEGLYRIGKNHGDIKPAHLTLLNKLNSEVVSKGQQLLVGYIVFNGDYTKQPKADITADDNTDKEVGLIKKDSVIEIAAAPIINQPTVSNNSKFKTPKKDPADTLLLTYNGEGFFKPNYLPGTQEILVMAAPFKSESGWADGKFYILTDSVPAGTVVKLINPMTNIFIYAKTLGGLPQVKGNNAVKLRLSNAGAVALGLRFEEQFELMLKN
ncbi:MAG: LysM peptidoglycan-binding domain-containing protein [Bacteroidota bacterium]